MSINRTSPPIADEDMKETYVEELRKLLGNRPIIFVAVPVLILDDQDRVLLQLRADDHTWCLPGGYMELGESTIETAQREIREETGLEIGRLSLFDVYSGREFFKEFPNGDQVFSVSVVYFTHDARGELRPDGQEGLELGYFSRKDLPSKLSDHARTIVESFWRKNGIA
jgi:8-oxo-dGTP pyrophosphatase MutT (NUDIX family)